MGSFLNFKNFGETPQPASPFSLTRQSSIYSLTFGELQSTYSGLGKDLGSMNMEDLLKNIWTAEGSQAFASPGGILHRQGSLMFPQTLSQKTIDEVLRDFQKEIGPKDSGIATWGQSSLGEMTLEEFLERAGVVRENTEHKTNVMVNAGTTQSSHHSKQSTAAFASHMQLGNNAQLPSSSNLDTSSLSPTPFAFNEGGRGRRGCGSLEKVVERRQKRMIKNRESAARSRARKQAYTLELEAEVAKLKEINQQLREKQAELLEIQKNQTDKSSEARGSKLICLRRTLTGPL